MRVVSGIQPSGDLHLGNFFGAIQQFLELQKEHDCFFIVVDYHALTTVHDPDTLRRLRIDCVCGYLALGLDPGRAAIFLQSDVPEVTELAWILSTVTPMGLLQRCHAYKDKVAKGIPAHHGLFAYPVLMAADILLYGAKLVPVGRDQKQHLEVTRDIAQAFNERYGRLFDLPKGRVMPLVPGADGQKMSKSHGNVIGIFESEEAIRRKVTAIRTDSKRPEEPKDPDRCNLFALFRLLAEPGDLSEMETRYRNGGIAYREVKERIADTFFLRFRDARQRREELRAEPAAVRAVLDAGKERARKVARATMERVRTAVGLQRYPGLEGVLP